MFPKYELKDITTIKTIKTIIESKPDRVSLIIRHSERYFHEQAQMEPFMGLTDNGKEAAVKLGRSLGQTPRPRFFTSHIGRCIETAYLIDKGYFMTHGRVNNNAIYCHDLSPFYIKDMKKAVAMVSETGADIFLRSWFNNEISEDIMLNPEETAEIIIGFMRKELKRLDKNEMGFFVSHDWNIFPVKEFFFGITHEKGGQVGYLDALFLFEKDNNLYLANHQKEPFILQ